jgi:hypothetical protein
MTTDRALLATQALGRPVGGWIADLRAARVSYRQIADDLRQATGIQVSHQTVKNWDPTAYRADRPA